jgi:large conductance mechanosensitive channel
MDPPHPSTLESKRMKGFRSFLLRGNVVDLAVGIVIGAAFTAVVNGFVSAFLTPIIGLITHRTGDFSTQKFTVNGVVFPYGTLISAFISFLLIAAVVYFCVVLPVNRLHKRFAPEKEPEAPTRECPECLSRIPAAARRCSFCTVEISASPAL